MKQTALEACLESLERWQREHESAMTAIDIEEVFLTLMGLHGALMDRPESIRRWLELAADIEGLVTRSGAANYEGSRIDLAAFEKARKRARGALVLAELPPLSAEDESEVQANVRESIEDLRGVWQP